ncbi:MAG: substrate-binding domain-containing protein [Ferruginibacter sp.]
MKVILNFVLLACTYLFIANGCRQKNITVADTPKSGTIFISVDESFRPVIEEQINVYESSFPGTHIIASYKPEAACIKDMLFDTTNRMVIITRGLSDKEDKFLFDSLKFRPSWNALATDAIAIIVNSSSNDTLFTLERLRQQLSGKISTTQKIVFDGLSTTSTLRFITDSVLKGDVLDTSLVKASKTSKDVIDFIAGDKNAVGLVGISWIGNPEDTAQLSLLKKVKIAYVKCSICKDIPYVKPLQQSILSKRYPLVRGLYYVLKENYNGLGSGFVNFLKYERGQLIFKRAYLGPTMDFRSRNIKINQTLPKN